MKTQTKQLTSSRSANLEQILLQLENKINSHLEQTSEQIENLNARLQAIEDKLGHKTTELVTYLPPMRKKHHLAVDILALLGLLSSITFGIFVIIKILF